MASLEPTALVLSSTLLLPSCVTLGELASLSGLPFLIYKMGLRMMSTPLNCVGTKEENVYEMFKQHLAESMNSPALPGTEETKLEAIYPRPRPALQMKRRKLSS